MPHAIIRGGNGRRHEVDFTDAEIRIEVYSSDETVEIVVEAINDLAPSDGRPFALLNIPRHCISFAMPSIFPSTRSHWDSGEVLGTQRQNSSLHYGQSAAATVF